MARIIHVDDEIEWIEVVRRSLVGHHVDSARSLAEALSLIQTSEPYDLALVDLNLVGQEDGMGCEVLDHLRLTYPQTRLVVITASPPAGDMRSTTFERFGLEGVIIKGKTTLPGLQSVVIRALRSDAGDIPRDVKVRESELSERYREWHDRSMELLRTHVRNAHERVRHSARESTQSAATAKTTLDIWDKLQQQFIADCGALEADVAKARTVQDVEATAALLEQAMSKYAAEISRLQRPQ